MDRTPQLERAERGQRREGLPVEAIDEAASPARHRVDLAEDDRVVALHDCVARCDRASERALARPQRHPRLEASHGRKPVRGTHLVGPRESVALETPHEYAAAPPHVIPLKQRYPSRFVDARATFSYGTVPGTSVHPDPTIWRILDICVPPTMPG